MIGENMGTRKENVALSSVLASALMTVMKLVVGLMTGSLGILSEAAHSLIDLGAASLTWFAVRVSDKPADDEHPYGHGKIESVSALIETGLLFLTSAWIVKEAVSRLMSERVDVEVTWYGVAVILVSIIIDFGRSRALSKVARETGSQALEADALHFSSDILSSAVVLLGLGFVVFGWQIADAIAAIGVAGFVLSAAYRLGKRTIDALIDTAPEGVAQQISALAISIPGVVRIERVRARPVGATVFVEVVVKISRTLPLERAQALRDEILTLITGRLPNVDPMVVVEPLTLEDEDIADTVRFVAANQNVGIHDIGIYDSGGRRHVGFTLEVDDILSIGDAHAVATAVEDRLAQELGGDLAIDIDIAPRRRGVVQGDDVDAAEMARILAVVQEVVSADPASLGVHRAFAQRGADGLYVSFHCTFAASETIGVAHEAILRIEHMVRRRLEGVARVVIHAEPETHVDRPISSNGLSPAAGNPR